MSARLSAKEFFGNCVDKPLDMVMLRRVFLLHMRIHWSAGENHYQDDADFSCLEYSDDATKSKLAVELTDILNEDDTDNFPGVFVGFKGGYKLRKNMLDYSSNLSEDNSKTSKNVQWGGTLAISHIHKSSDTALAMADSSFVFLMAVRETLMDHFPIGVMDFEGVTDPQKLDPKKSNSFFKVDLLVSVEFTATVNISLEGHRLKTYGIELSPTS